MEYEILFYGLNAYPISKEETTRKCLTNPLSVRKRIFMVTISCMKSMDVKVHNILSVDMNSLLKKLIIDTPYCVRNTYFHIKKQKFMLKFKSNEAVHAVLCLFHSPHFYHAAHTKW